MSTVIICANDQVRRQIIETVKNSAMGKEIKDATLAELEALPGCEGALLVDFEDADKPKGKKPGAKRGPSAYNLFVKDCMASPELAGIEKATDRMKECGPRWKAGGDELKKKYELQLSKLKG